MNNGELLTGVRARFIGADQDWHGETTTYWFELSGVDYGTGYEFEEGEVYGIVESPHEDSAVVNGDAYPYTEGDPITIAIRRHAVVTDDIRQKASGR